MDIEWFDYPDIKPRGNIDYTSLLPHDGETVFLARYEDSAKFKARWVDAMVHEWLEEIQGIKQWAYWPDIPMEYKVRKLITR